MTTNETSKKDCVRRPRSFVRQVQQKGGDGSNQPRSAFAPSHDLTHHTILLTFRPSLYLFNQQSNYHHEANHRQPDPRLRRRLPAPHGPQCRPQELQRSRHEGAFPISFTISYPTNESSQIRLLNSAEPEPPAVPPSINTIGSKTPSSFHQGYSRGLIPSRHILCRLLATVRSHVFFLRRKIQVGPSAFRQIEVGGRIESNVSAGDNSDGIISCRSRPNCAVSFARIVLFSMQHATHIHHPPLVSFCPFFNLNQLN